MVVDNAFVSKLSEHKRVVALSVLLIVISILQAFFVYYETHTALTAAFSLVAVLAICIVAILFLVVPCDGAKLTVRWLFPAVLFMLCICALGLYPPHGIPDEPFHFASVYELSNHILGAESMTIRGTDEVLFDDTFIEDRALSSASIKNVIANFQIISGPSDYMDMPVNDAVRTGDTSFLGLFTELRIPAVIGVVVGRALGLGALPVFYLGRLTNALCGIALVSMAVRITPVGRNAFMAVALFPMTLSLLGSYSYDSICIGLSFLLIALYLKAIYGPDDISAKRLLPIVITSVLLAPCKIVYCLINVLAVCIPQSKFSTKREAYAVKAVLIAVPLLAVCMTRFNVLSATIANAAESGETGSAEVPAKEYMSVTYVITHPFSSLAMFFRTLDNYGEFYLTSLVGGEVGVYAVKFKSPAFFWGALLMLSILAAQRTNDDELDIAPSKRGMFLVLGALIFLATVFVMWTKWTTVDSRLIEGVQGRYVLPVLPMILLSLRTRLIKIDCNLAFPIVVTFLAADLMHFSWIAMRAMIG